jgi:hypothetical protein
MVPEIPMGWLIEITPPVPEPGAAIPAGEDTTTPVTWMGAEVSKLPGAMVNVAVAKTPALMTLLFIP